MLKTQTLMASTQSSFEKNVAFVVGIIHYDNDASTLDTPTKDAELVTKSLQTQGFDVVMETGFTTDGLQGLLNRLQDDYQKESLRLEVFYPSYSIAHEETEAFNRDLETNNASIDVIESEQQAVTAPDKDLKIYVSQDENVVWQHQEEQIKALEKERDEAEKQRIAAQKAITEIENQRTAAVLQQKYAEKQSKRDKKRTKKAVFLTGLAGVIGLIALTAGIIAVFKNMESTKQKELSEIKAIEVQRELRNALISKRSKLNDSLKILVQEIELFGHAQEYGFVENRYNQFNNTWATIEKLNTTIRDSILLNDKFTDNFKWSVPPDAAYKRRTAALKTAQ
jgi:Caspase domain